MDIEITKDVKTETSVSLGETEVREIILDAIEAKCVKDGVAFDRYKASQNFHFDHAHGEVTGLYVSWSDTERV